MPSFREHILSHWSNLSAGVAVLFSPIVKLKVKILSKNEVDPGNLLIVKAEISNLIFLFVNIYVPNIGAERIRLFTKLEDFLKTTT